MWVSTQKFFERLCVYYNSILLVFQYSVLVFCTHPLTFDSTSPSIEQQQQPQTMHHETPEDSAVSGDAPDFFHVPGIQIKSNGHKCNILNNQTPIDIRNDPRFSNAPARCVIFFVVFVFVGFVGFVVAVCTVLFCCFVVVLFWCCFLVLVVF